MSGSFYITQPGPGRTKQKIFFVILKCTLNHCHSAAHHKELYQISVKKTFYYKFLIMQNYRLSIKNQVLTSSIFYFFSLEESLELTVSGYLDSLFRFEGKFSNETRSEFSGVKRLNIN